MKMKMVFAILLLIVVAPSFAATPARSTDVNFQHERQKQRQKQRQHQWQAQDTRVTDSNRNTAAGGDANANAQGGDSAASNEGNTTSVNAGTTSHDTFIPAVVPETPAAIVAASDIVLSRSACGPLMRTVPRQVTGTYHGLMSTNNDDLGEDDTLTSVLDDRGQPIAFRVDGGRLIGSQVVVIASTLGVASARNLSLGGGGSTGNWGEAGGGGSSSMQRLVVRAIVTDCVYQ